MPADELPHGAIPKFKPRDKHHRRLFGGHNDAPFLFTTFTNAAWFVNRPAAMDAMLSSQQKLILANVEDDDLLYGRRPDDEVERIEALKPAFYIPSDRWVYEDTMTKREQLEEIDKCLRWTREVTERVRVRSDLPTRIIPIAKGWEEWHFERCRETFRDLGLSYCAFDVTQYPSGQMVVADVTRLVDVVNPTGVLLIGRLAKDTLRDCPREVVAATGVNQWLENCQASGVGFSRQKYSDWAAETNKALFSVQAELGDFAQESTETRLTSNPTET
ncbi:hypothetical protein [Natrinema versiforme]|uniref:Uncharacterized protein n=1 Tax=Natrinema versiforme TaxID=88724 RepID=A0A4P8WNH8_9EURY|nr:hypothetical protein [Natrinema versiforme]QCS43601.1 hypothetical protein FEJ81_15045 [Natrinema versiforme]